ncbi:hypothetical protein CSKR_203961 [Clonorchis sinensis]|uniref:Uncharacterized protein n=1 Tax=Clonorchis sinensis TaxID=79923 RepID=A0A8T1MK71_CLOSI|nr:hypothetical protein CSKR_203961 [Clonorchis sinensis]
MWPPLKDEDLPGELRGYSPPINRCKLAALKTIYKGRRRLSGCGQKADWEDLLDRRDGSHFNERTGGYEVVQGGQDGTGLRPESVLGQSAAVVGSCLTVTVGQVRRRRAANAERSVVVDGSVERGGTGASDTGNSSATDHKRNWTRHHWGTC